MIDIHTHILPGVDDGAQDLEDACMMAALAAESQVDTIVCTPHCNVPGEYGNYWNASMADRLAQLTEVVHTQGCPVTLLPGMEIYTTDDVADKIRTGRVISLNFTRYYLMEFGFHESAVWMTEILDEVVSEFQIVPVIAHPERYACVQKDPFVVRDWLEIGCQLQINKGSLFGRFGRGAWRAAGELLVNRFVSYAASDAHGPYQRTTYLRDAYDFLSGEFSERMARRLLIENPAAMLASEKLPGWAKQSAICGLYRNEQPTGGAKQAGGVKKNDPARLAGS